MKQIRVHNRASNKNLKYRYTKKSDKSENCTRGPLKTERIGVQKLPTAQVKAKKLLVISKTV